MSGYAKRSGWAHVFDMGEEWAAAVAAANPTTRVRRGKVVEIPPEWRGEVTRPQTIRKRDSKQRRKTVMRRDGAGWSAGHPRNWPPRHTPKGMAIAEEPCDER